MDTSTEKKRIAILGDGSWGTAMAAMLSKKHDVSMWGVDPNHVEQLKKEKENKKYLAGFPLEGIHFTSSKNEAIENSDVILFVVPSKYLREVAKSFEENINDLIKNKIKMNKQLSIVSLTKGFEQETWLRPSQIITQEIKLVEDVMVLSGPSHAEEVISNMPTGVTIAGRDDDVLVEMQETLSAERFRVYRHDDPIGVEICGAVKNIIAIASGISSGLGFGINAGAALVTRGVKEMERFALRFGGNPATMYGLAGVGDLIATALSKHSRNFSLGLSIAKGIDAKQYMNESVMVCEGAETVKAVVSYAQTYNIYMPISSMVYRVLYQQLDPLKGCYELMNSPHKDEII